MIVWLSGPTGAGKSTAAGLFERKGFSVVREIVPTEIFVDFSIKPKQYCLQLQTAMMLARQSQWLSLKEKTKIVFDRSVDEDYEVFCRMHQSIGMLNDVDMSTLRSLYCNITTLMPPPDIILYFTANKETLSYRIKNHPDIIRESLDIQLMHYEQWIAGRYEDVLIIENSKCRFDSIIRILS